MGEKIRDLHTLRICDAVMTVELNESFSKKDNGGGYDIHIQNDHFRYAVNVNSFIKLASVILRAEDEMHYFKNNPENLKSGTDFPPVTDISESALSSVQTLSRIFSSSGIDYRFIEAG